MGNSNWGSYGMCNVSGLGEGAGLVEGLLVGDMGSNGSDDGFSSKNRFFSKNGAGVEGFGDDGGGLNSLDGGWDVGVGGFSGGNSLDGNFWCYLGKSLSSADGIGKVTSQPVVLDGGGIVSRCTDKNLSGCWEGSGEGSREGSGDSQLGSSLANSHEHREDSDKGIHFG